MQLKGPRTPEGIGIEWNTASVLRWWCPFTEENVNTTEKNEILNLLKPTGYVMQQQFNIQQLYALPTLYFCVLYLSENKLRLVPLTA